MSVISLFSLLPNNTRVRRAAKAAVFSASRVAVVASMAGSRQRGRALAIQAVARAVSLFAGSTVGGRMVDTLDWRWMVWANVPVGIMGAIIAWFIVLETNAARSGHFDYIGQYAVLSFRKT
jgi:predicted MFS family arabinose efflux permease